jgi:hypothetical protein
MRLTLVARNEISNLMAFTFQERAYVVEGLRNAGDWTPALPECTTGWPAYVQTSCYTPHPLHVEHQGFS